MSPRKLSAVAAATAMLALPAASLAQSAGDQQYQDPLGGQSPEPSEPVTPSTPAPPSGAGSAPAQPTTTAPATPSAAPSSVPLARTGLDVRPLLAIGLALIAAAALLVMPRRRRTWR